MRNNYFPEGRLLNTAENTANLSSLERLKESMNKNYICEARADVCDFEHNLIVDLFGVKGIIPREEGATGIKEGTVRDIAIISRVNKPICFVIDSIDLSGEQPVAYLSRAKAQKKCQEEFISKLTAGDIIPARVTHLESFGAFCDIGCGIIALMPIDAISVSRISHPKDRFSTGDDIYAVVKGIDEQGRISLSHRELLGTWQQNAQRFEQGQTVSGIIRTVEDYGVFIELAPNLAGLAEKREDVYPGQHASVYIKSMIPEKMKVKLIIIDSFDADYQPPNIEYYIDSDHISSWNYSPDSCIKQISTSF